VNELDGDMLGVGGGATFAKRKQSPALPETPGHRQASLGNPGGFGLEEKLRDRDIPLEMAGYNFS
jgi:hypothetical protein